MKLLQLILKAVLSPEPRAAESHMLGRQPVYWSKGERKTMGVWGGSLQFLLKLWRAASWQEAGQAEV